VHVGDRDGVLLNVALTWAMPSASTTRLVFFADSHYLVTFFLPAIARRGPFLVRALVCVRWPRTGRPRRWRDPAVRADVHQALDVHRDLGAQGTLDAIQRSIS
jgi:hypothetical protein